MKRDDIIAALVRGGTTYLDSTSFGGPGYIEVILPGSDHGIIFDFIAESIYLTEGVADGA